MRKEHRKFRAKRKNGKEEFTVILKQNHLFFSKKIASTPIQKPPINDIILTNNLMKKRG